MNIETQNLKNLGLAAAAVATASTALAADKQAVENLVANIKSTSDAVRGPAWQGAGPIGAPAVKPLAAVMTDPDFEIARSAKRAIWKIVHYAGRPGAPAEKKAVAAELIPLLAQGIPDVVRREALWMLSEVGDDEAVAPVAALIANKELREDARMSLERIPGDKSLAALKAALASVPEDFKPNIAHSLRVRGVQEKRYPSQKLVPTRSVGITPPV